MNQKQSIASSRIYPGTRSVCQQRRQSLTYRFCKGITSLRFASLTVTVFLLASCGNDPKSPGWAYFPDMVYSQAYETYTQNPNFSDGQTAREPVAGTIARGTLPNSQNVDDAAFEQSYLFKSYYPATPDGYDAAGANLKNPVEVNDQVLADGKAIFEIYCQVCHGAKGDGQGSIVETGAFPPVNPYTTLLKNLPEGKMFHSITYGKNLMGSYSSQVSPEDRWKVICYIQKLSAMGRFAPENQQQVSDGASTSANTNK